MQCSKFVTIDAFRTLATRIALRFRRLKHFDPTKNLNPKPLLRLARSTITTAASPSLFFASSDNETQTDLLPLFDLPPQLIVAMSAIAVFSRASSRGVASCLRSSGIRSVGFPRAYVLSHLLPFLALCRACARPARFTRIDAGVCGGVSRICGGAAHGNRDTDNYHDLC